MKTQDIGGYGKYRVGMVPTLQVGRETAGETLPTEAGETVVVIGGEGVTLLNAFGYHKPTVPGRRYIASVATEEATDGGYGRVCMGTLS
jgi:hypothetical protein